MNKRGIEFAFNWIFSIMVGAVFIFVAVYAATSFIKSEKKSIDTENVQELETLLNPLQTTVESITKPRSLIFPSETKLEISCNLDSFFGNSILVLSSSSGFGKEWESRSVPNKISSYLFSEKYLQGKEFSVLVVPFFMPYKVADLIVLWTGKYCFVNSPSYVVNELNSLANGSSIELRSAKSLCSSNSKSVCFIDTITDVDEGCDIRVNTYLKQVRSKGKVIYYEDSLLYPAIFSSADNFECNIKRLSARAKYLANVYIEKSRVIAVEDGCSSLLQADLQNFISLLNLSSSRDLSTAYALASELQDKQEELICSLWK